MPRLGRRLPRAFFARPSTQVAPELLGRILVRRHPDGTRLAVRLVEVEAYEEGDPASHSYRGPTARNGAMFGPPGHLYVYRSYGLHWCMNVVTGRPGEGSAVLLRAGEPVAGLEAMAARRGLDDPRRLCAGPGRMTQALAVDGSHDGIDLVRGREVALHEGEPVARGATARTARVGLSVGIDARWRYLVRGDPFVSRARPSVRAGGAAIRRG